MCLLFEEKNGKTLHYFFLYFVPLCHTNKVYWVQYTPLSPKNYYFIEIVHKYLVMNWLCKTLCKKLDNPDNIDEITQVGAATSGTTNIKNEQKPKRTTCQLWHNLVQRPRRTFTKKQMEEHNLGIILIAMSSLFIFCQSFKIIPDLYEIIHCNHVGSLGDNCEFAPVCCLPVPF